ncbi:MAG TPA: substrate-binding domain-containing protein [Paludibacteraceae bacterium]|jgi:phosphate transport system substrate-binding protein|nr:substrate-binding domain-containing protein [Paludibacteraceae bacterium]MDS1031634.1 substrate-binding domain-containing protein [Porphyromonadaceae sp. NP-X]NLJ20790.1 phosphate ABC transporter substrate-binding protein [Bacteroidales bacterium]HOH54626.1 substrate-binding domain-containing protein [Paludibacteraceae bacterium]
MIRKFRIYFLSVVLIFTIISCRREVKKDRFTDTLTSGVIPVAVDETFEPVIEEEIDVFESLYPNAGIVPKYTSEVEAINLLMKDSVRLAITTRPLSSKEENYFKAKKFEPKSYKLASDAIALIVNKSNPDTLITVDQLRQILLGKITKWNQIYPKSNLGDITMVFDNPNSSTVRFAIDSICGGLPLSDRLKAQGKNAEVLNFVSKTRNAIGVIGVNWLSNKADSTNLSFIDIVKVMSVTNEATATVDNCYKPFQAYIYYGDYPLSRNIFVIINDPRHSLPTGFTSFLTSDKGQRIILKAGLVPATQPIRVVNVKNERINLK